MLVDIGGRVDEWDNGWDRTRQNGHDNFITKLLVFLGRCMVYGIREA